MHPISDKELDKLFQQRFEDLQIEPSNELWDKISDKLDKKKPAKRTFSIFWMAAASVVVVLSAGLWFTRLDEKIIAQESPEIVKQEKKKITQESVNHDLDEHLLEDKSILMSSGSGSELPDELSKAELKTEIESNKNSPEIKAPVEQSEVVIASNVIKRPIITQPKQPVKVPARYSGDQSNLDLSQPDLSRDDLIASNNNSDRNSGDEFSSNAKNRKVRGVGGLVNFVISQVDKREDKLIEFSESDEGTEVSGINLGVLKIKSKK